MTEFIEHPRLIGGVPVPDDDARHAIALRPLGLLYGAAAQAAREAGIARQLAGGPIAFTACEIFVETARRVDHAVAAVSELPKWTEGSPAVAAALAALLEVVAQARPPFAGMAIDRPRIMGILNATPDSFSDGGAHENPEQAVRHAKALIAEGADIIDIGGESTRPGAEPVSPDIELNRVMPVIERLSGANAILSIDTRHAAVMQTAVNAGCDIVNDVSALSDDPRALDVVAASRASVILMHKRGASRTMQDDPAYGHAPYEIWRYLRDRVAACERAGIPRARIAVDPGIGFGKTARHNQEIIQSLTLLHGLGCGIVLGASRKLSGGAPGKARLHGSIAATALAVAQGVQLHRVHDVMETRQALSTANRLLSAE